MKNKKERKTTITNMRIQPDVLKRWQKHAEKFNYGSLTSLISVSVENQCGIDSSLLSKGKSRLERALAKSIFYSNKAIESSEESKQYIKVALNLYKKLMSQY